VPLPTTKITFKTHNLSITVSKLTAQASNQQPYAAYSNWFAHQYAAAASGQGTPQPATTATASTTTSYGYYVPNQQQQKPAAQGTSAVANTAAMSKSISNGSAWSGYTVGQQPTLPQTTPTATNGVQQSK